MTTGNKKYFVFLLLFFFISPLSANFKVIAQSGRKVMLQQADIVGEITISPKTEKVNQGSNQTTSKINYLTGLVPQIQSMVKIVDSEKSVIVDNINMQIKNLTEQQKRVDSATDSASLKTNTQTLGELYRVYTLFVPKIHIVLAADRIADVVDDLNILSGKLNTRISLEKNKNKDTKQLDILLEEMNKNISDSRDQAQKSLDAIKSLGPDQGNKSVFEANKISLNKAIEIFNSGQKSARLAFENAKQIRKGLSVMPKETNSPQTPSVPPLN